MARVAEIGGGEEGTKTLPPNPPLCPLTWKLVAEAARGRKPVPSCGMRAVSAVLGSDAVPVAPAPPHKNYGCTLDRNKTVAACVASSR